MTTHTLNNHELLVVDVPEDAFDIRVINQTLEGWKTTGGIYWYRDLPPGNYSLLLTEEDAKGVVEESCWGGSFPYWGFKNYENSHSKPFHEAIESLHSWIRSKGYEPGKVVVLVKTD